MAWIECQCSIWMIELKLLFNKINVVFMKKITLLVALVFGLSSVYAQVKEAKRFMSQGQNNALVVYA